uniref:Uncharacterized protein n=1 Tax=Amphimedon queenslandica TaxID=400682 RepID=A0A1X7UL86_AMPQE
MFILFIVDHIVVPGTHQNMATRLEDGDPPLTPTADHEDAGHDGKGAMRDPEGLPTDPSLAAVGGTSHPILPVLGDTAFGLPLPTCASSDPTKTVLTVKGLPPIAAKLLDRIRRRELIDLSLLLHDPASMAEKMQRGQVMIVQSIKQAQKRRWQILDIFFWTLAFALKCQWQSWN